MSDALSELTKPFREDKAPEGDALRRLFDFIKLHNCEVRMTRDRRPRMNDPADMVNGTLVTIVTRNEEAYAAFIVGDSDNYPDVECAFFQPAYQAIERAVG